MAWSFGHVTMGTYSSGVLMSHTLPGISKSSKQSSHIFYTPRNTDTEPSSELSVPTLHLRPQSLTRYRNARQTHNPLPQRT